MVEQDYKIIVEGFDEPFPCAGDQRVLIAMERAGLTRIPVGCRGGGCGVCKVLILGGRYRTGKMSRVQITAEEERTGHALACRLYPKSDLDLRAIGKLFSHSFRGYQQCRTN